MSTRTHTTAAAGAYVFGEKVIAETIQLSTTTEDNTSGIRPRNSFGFSYFGKRAYSRPEAWTPRDTSDTGGDAFSSISITSITGALVGRIRIDHQNTIFHSLEFTNNQQGCADFTLKLNALPDFPILRFSVISVKFFDTEFNWYKGIIDYVPEDGSARDYYEFRGFGFSKLLGRVTIEETYPLGLDVGEIVDDIAGSTEVANAGVAYLPGNIDTSTGVVTVSDHDLSKNKVTKYLDLYRNMGNAYCGVGADGAIFFEEKTEDLVRTLFEGYDFDQFEVEVNLKAIFNSIIVQRQTALGSGGSGWAIATVRNNDTSIAKYGLNEKTFQIPGMLSDADAQTIGDAVLAQESEVKYSATVKGIPLKSQSAFLDRGNYRFIRVASRFTEVIQECDDVADWSAPATGIDFEVATETTSIISGSSAIEISWTYALGGDAFATCDFSGSIQVVRIWVRSTLTGQPFSFGFGISDFTENLTPISVVTENQYFPISIDTSGLGLTSIGQIGFKILTSEAGSIICDRCEVEAKGNKHYTMELNEATYYIGPDDARVNATFGPFVERSTSDYTAAVLAQAEENKFTGLIR